MLTIDEARGLVARAATYFDRGRPGWWDEVDTGRLDMTTSCLCIMGQIATAANTTGWGGLISLFTAQGLGDYVREMRPAVFRDDSKDYPILQDAWIEAIADRKIQAEAPDLRRQLLRVTIERETT